MGLTNVWQLDAPSRHCHFVALKLLVYRICDLDKKFFSLFFLVFSKSRELQVRRVRGDLRVHLASLVMPAEMVTQEPLVTLELTASQVPLGPLDLRYV